MVGEGRCCAFNGIFLNIKKMSEFVFIFKMNYVVRFKFIENVADDVKINFQIKKKFNSFSLVNRTRASIISNPETIVQLNTKVHLLVSK